MLVITICMHYRKTMQGKEQLRILAFTICTSFSFALFDYLLNKTETSSKHPLQSSSFPLLTASAFVHPHEKFKHRERVTGHRKTMLSKLCCRYILSLLTFTLHSEPSKSSLTSPYRPFQSLISISCKFKRENRGNFKLKKKVKKQIKFQSSAMQNT